MRVKKYDEDWKQVSIINILMVGSTLDVKGGMTTVVEGFTNNDFSEKNLYYIPTHKDGSRISQIMLFAKNIIKILYYLIFKDISIVHIHFSERGSFIRKNIVSKISKLCNKKVIIHMHGAEFKEFYNEGSLSKQKSIQKFLLGADKVIVLGESWQQFVKSINKNIETIIMPNFVTCVHNSPDFDLNEIRILFLAVLIKRKGIYELVESINNLVKSNRLANYNIKVIVAGSGSEEKNIKELVEKYNLDNMFDFKGWVDKYQKEELLKSSSIFVLPSYNEGLPVSILEAMSYGLPVITTNVGSIEDAVKHNYNGIIINPGNIQELEKAILKLIENKNICYEFSDNSKSLVNKYYNKDGYFEKIEVMYGELSIK